MRMMTHSSIITEIFKEPTSASTLEDYTSNTLDWVYWICSTIIYIPEIVFAAHGVSPSSVWSTVWRIANPSWNVVDGVGSLTTLYSRHREQQKPIYIKLPPIGQSEVVASDVHQITIEKLNEISGDDLLINYLDIFNGTQLLTVQAIAYTPLLSATFNVIAPGFAFALSMGLTAIAETIKYQQANTIVQHLKDNSVNDTVQKCHLTKAGEVSEKHKLTAIAYGCCFIAMLKVAIVATRRRSTGGTAAIIVPAAMVLLSAVVRSYVHCANKGNKIDFSLFGCFKPPNENQLGSPLLRT